MNAKMHRQRDQKSVNRYSKSLRKRSKYIFYCSIRPIWCPSACSSPQG
ncbi:hypothetical protein CAMGR0001_0731 [Campylobacter gracilis RM3268]|uniref:Uncharacterized protein n=1 Tax=Campylobacter gracilis RM3268 TaxID=553220 RepID=C8PFT9_9BACT|nr:hypothetical protein CAMGR0001_0731 [Campylobacter gracilis RM3268]